MTPRSREARTSVLYVDGSMGFGGAVRSLSLLLTGLQGAVPTVLTTQDREIAEREFGSVRRYRVRRLLNYRLKDRIVAVLERTCPWSSLRAAAMKALAVVDALETAAMTAAIMLAAKRSRASLLHVNTGFMIEAIKAARLLRIPCVVHVRQFFGRESAKIVATLPAHSHVIGVSAAITANVRDLGVPASRTSTVYNPVDVRLFDAAAPRAAALRVRYGVGPDDLAIGIFGRVIPWKGQRVFVRAVLKALDQGASFVAFIVGDEADGSREYIDELRAIVANSRYPTRFVFTGYQRDIEAFYRAMDIVVHASVEPEPFGRVIVEAMAAGRPVIATAAGGPVELVDDGVDGILVPPEDVEALADAMLRLAADSTLRETMGRRGYEKALQRYAPGMVGRQVEAIYAAVLREHRQGARGETGVPEAPDGAHGPRKTRVVPLSTRR